MQIIAKHKALTHLLVVLLDNGPLPTRKLFALHGSGQGPALVKQALELGLIKRYEQEPEGQGNWLMINKLTAKGRRIAKLAKKIYSQ